MRLGDMRHRVSLEREQRTANGQGGHDTTWSHVADLYAAIEGQSGQEAMNAGVERSVTRWRVTIRSTSATAKDRINWNGLKLSIVSAMPDPKNRGFQLLLCESGAVP